MASYATLDKTIKDFNRISFLLPLEARKQLKELEESFKKLKYQIDNFNKRFSDNGWIAYDSLNSQVIEKANELYETEGLGKAEEYLVEYYRTDIENSLWILKNNSSEFAVRYELLKKAFQDHKEERYHSSVVIFLIIIDGVINDFAKGKGFFSKGVEFNVWDSLVGETDTLNKLKSIYNTGRKKTNTEPIYLPYRNGILHGRDVNYANKYVSSKCLALIFAVHDYIKSKRSEESRKEKYNQDHKEKSWEEIFAQQERNKQIQKVLQEWKRQEVIVGETIPSRGNEVEYDNYDYIKPVIRMLKCWKDKNYGQLSRILNGLFKYEKLEKLRPKHCRELFQDKELLEYELLEVEDRAIALKRILIKAKWKVNDKVKEGNLEMGINYQGLEGSSAVPNIDEGEWIIIPWNFTDLYKLD